MEHITNGEPRGTRGILAASAATLAAGIATTTDGLIADSTTKCASGASIIIIALTTLSLIIVRRWVTDTSVERSRLAAAEAAAHNEHARYIAGLAAVDAERARVRRDVGTIARRNRAVLETERAALQAQFEAERERISTEAFRTGATMQRAGLLDERQSATVTHLFPLREHQAADTGTVSRHPS